MITLKEIKPNVFHLQESILGFDSTDTTNWYWDLDRKLLSEKIDFPDSMLTRKLDEADLKRFEEYYKPLIIKRKQNDE